EKFRPTIASNSWGHHLDFQLQLREDQQDDVVLSKRNPAHKLVWPIEKEKIEMENGEGNLESKFAGLTVTDPYNINGNDGLFQVMKAVEAAEATIKQQDIAVKVQEHEQEILQLRKHLTEFSIKEAQIQNEKYALEKRISYMRLAAKQERLTFVSSLMPLLAEYSLQPPVADAQSIVSNVKIKNGLELVPQPTYSDGKMPSSDRQTSMVEDILGFPQSGRENLKNFEHDELERHPPLASSNIASDEVPSQLVFSQAEQHTVRSNEGTVGKKVTFGDLVRSSEIDEPENRGHPSDREPSANWNSKASATTTMDDPNSSYSPYLPPVLEEPSSSFSEGAKQPNYLVTADDVDTYLAIEVQPLDDRKRKTGYLDIWEPATLAIKRDGYSIKCSGPSGVVVAEKFSSSTIAGEKKKGKKRSLFFNK
ncbi:UNVERIFIED_CONTAM: hypothetical protein Sindi_2890500, partial [Sesamum indicum]